MTCKEVQDNLFAYIDGDILEQERIAIEKHFDTCEKCRKVLAEIKTVKKDLLQLRETPPLPEIKEKTIQEAAAKQEKTRRILRPALIALPVILLLAILLPISFSNGASTVLAKAYAATNSLDSLRCELDEIQQGETLQDTPYVLHSLSEYSAPDRFHVTSDIEIKMPGYIPASIDYFYEVISIDETVYVYFHDSHLYFTPDKDWFTNMIPTKEESLEMLTLLKEIRTLDDETIDGEPCHHYSGSIDMEKYREQRTPQLEKSYYRLTKNTDVYYQDMDAFIESWFQHIGDAMFMELWIGKSDYIVRKSTVTRSDLSTSEVRFYDFNEEIVIEPPMDENDNLLEGWISSNIEE